ncbi:MAG: cysteine desulfurase [Puniceicoccales bacterium]|jgi:cysteine desulfurase/selenocysteine lyase|nr:cysteine desulfurase [Puniceicoccales bacterium]
MENDFPAAALARQFPLLVARPELAYLDSAATSQLHESVIERIVRFYREDNATVHRSSCPMGSEATVAYAAARKFVAQYVNAADATEIVFVRSTTEAINLVANSWGRTILRPGDEVLLTAMEHHSNILPWQDIAKRQGAGLRLCAITAAGEIDRDDFLQKLTERTKMVAIGHVSNVLGTVNPLDELIPQARRVGAAIFVDGAQRVASGPIDVQRLGCDFYALSGHKAFAPMGIGVLYGRCPWLKTLPPYQLGGGMVDRVSMDCSTFREPPEKWEAGTPNVAGALALRSALEFLRSIDWKSYDHHCASIRSRMDDAVRSLPGVRILGSPEKKTAIFSFVSDRVHAHDLATALSTKGICVRAGHHCAQPLHAAYGVPASCRASFSLYNAEEDCDRLIDGIRWALDYF